MTLTFKCLLQFLLTGKYTHCFSVVTQCRTRQLLKCVHHVLTVTVFIGVNNTPDHQVATFLPVCYI